MKKAEKPAYFRFCWYSQLVYTAIAVKPGKTPFLHSENIIAAVYISGFFPDQETQARKTAFYRFFRLRDTLSGYTRKSPKKARFQCEKSGYYPGSHCSRKPGPGNPEKRLFC